MKKINVSPEQIRHLFLTHTDMDHAGTIDLFKNAGIYLSQKEKQMIDGTTHRSFCFYHNMPIKKKYLLLNDGDEVKIGTTRITSIDTPGHTPGSMCYLINNKILITGDTFRLKKGKIKLFFWPYNMDEKSQKESINKLKALKDISLLCTAHTGYTDI